MCGSFDIKKRNCILQELGIILWKPRYPIFLDDQKSIKLCSYFKLLLISDDSSISLDDLFVRDVIRSMKIDFREVYIFTIRQIKTVIIPTGFFCHSWWIGTEVLIELRGICLRTPSLSILKYNIQAKCNLWRQINCMFYNA